MENNLLLAAIKAKLDKITVEQTPEKLEQSITETVARIIVNTPDNFTQLKSLADWLQQEDGGGCSAEETVAILTIAMRSEPSSFTVTTCLTQEEYDALPDDQKPENYRIIA